MTKSGRFGCILVQPELPKSELIGVSNMGIFREHLLSHFLVDSISAYDYLRQLENHSIMLKLKGFHLIVGDGSVCGKD